jgi:anaerobic magnesium-protoporphyrin IX monomethyl ester cyclase
MKSHPVVFVSLNDYDNLGVGYVASLLSDAGFAVKIIDPRRKESFILKTLKTLDPLLVGFSIIFLNSINIFIDLIDYLRKGGIDCHFTAGGHFASLKYDELFRQIPGLDSIIRFEGEYPLLDLVRHLDSGRDWKGIRSVAYKERNKIITNPVWPLEKELDKLPFPLRSPLKKYAFNKRFTTIIAGRGCIHNCSFCNTKAFYRLASGPLKRVRKPEAVVTEMDYLYHKKNCSVFLFHDDDFPVRSAGQKNWLNRFCLELARTGLNNKVLWKINCRPDDVKEETFLRMRSYGLFLVFLGIEDGTDDGLKTLNKQMTVEGTIKGVSILKKLNIGFDFGFMLFQPSTTYKSLNKNLDFLRQLCGDGYTPVTFVRLIPDYETRIEKQLKKAGRLLFTDGIGDFNLPEESLNHYFDFTMDCFDQWLRDPHGVTNISKWVRNYYLVYSRYFGADKTVMNLKRKFIRIVSASNLFLLDIMKELSEIFKEGAYLSEINLLTSYRERINNKHELFRNRIYDNADQLFIYSETAR